jgi:hypothetical protein
MTVCSIALVGLGSFSTPWVRAYNVLDCGLGQREKERREREMGIEVQEGAVFNDIYSHIRVNWARCLFSTQIRQHNNKQLMDIYGNKWCIRFRLLDI